MTGPSVGRIVHYRPFAGPASAPLTPPCHAAIIVALHPTGADPRWLSAADHQLMPGLLLTLCVFTADGPRMHDAEQDERTGAGGTWHWPEATPEGTTA